MLDDRKTAILSAVVQEYIATALPVGSTHIADAPGVRVSSATVRNEMAVLEQEGYLVQPHTSAGRIPTDKGYRFFVDHMATPGRIDAATSSQVGDFFRTAHGRLEEMLHRTSDLLATLTNYAAVVVGPQAGAVDVRSVQIVRLTATLATVVIVLGNGAVESEPIALADEVSDAQVAAASAHVAAQLVGSSLAAVASVVPSGDETVDRVCADALGAVRDASSDEHVYVGGTASMASAFDAVEVVRDVLRTLEQQFVVVSLIGDLVQRGLSVAIGVEHGVEPLVACSVIVAPVLVDGEQRGSVGVLGPTRMNYPQALATVEVVSDRLGRRLEDAQTMADYYELLGVSRSASNDEIKRAYRQRARELHPDANPDDAATAERFKEVARAYQVLSDPDQRARYDRFGEAGVSGAGSPRGEDVFGGGGLNDLFDAFFGGQNPFGGGGRRGPSGPPRGQDLEVVVDITFQQAVFGDEVPVSLKLPQRCEECSGSGAGAGTRPVTCAECNGSGQVQRVRQSLLGQMVTSSPCPRCSGLGQVIATPCARCRGEGRITADHTYTVDVPAGVDTGSTLRLSGRGAAGPRGGRAGDLFVHLRVAQHDRYWRDGNDLVTTVPISIAQAALGTTIDLPTLDGDEELVVPAGAQPGREFVLRGRGVPRLQGRGRGDLRAQLVVEVPTKLDEDEAALLRQYADKRGEAVNPPDKGLFSRIKSAFS